MQPHEQASFLTAISQFIQEQVDKGIAAATAPLLTKIESLENTLLAESSREGDLVELTYDAVMKNLPVPKDGKDADMHQVAELIEHERAQTGEALLRISDVIKQIQDKMENWTTAKDGKDGKDGVDGAPGKDGMSITVEDIRPIVEEIQEEAELVFKQRLDDYVAGLPIPKDGEPGKDAEPVDYVKVTEITRDLLPRYFEQNPVLDWEKISAEVASHVWNHFKANPIRDGEDGPPGKDGTSVTMDDVMPVVAAAVDKAVAGLPRPTHVLGGLIDRDGVLCLNLSDGQISKIGKVVGEDGKDVDPDQVRKLLQEMVNALPPPTNGRDGRDGVDGKDGIGFDFMALEQVTDREFKFVVSNVDGSRSKDFALRIDLPLYRGMYVSGQTYQRGDLVTLGGSMWYANKETSVRPETGLEDWTIAAKRGRDGKQGSPGPAGMAGKDGKDGRDLTQLGFDGKKF